MSQGNYQVGMEAMREARARDDFKPSNPQVWGYRLADNGVPFKEVILNKHWLQASLKSFYGVFGYFTVFSPGFAYISSAVFMLVLCSLTVISLFLHWNDVSIPLRLMVLSSPIIIILSILLSMVNSWTYDFQPQGRYLFASLVPLSILAGGLPVFENRWVKRFRALGWAGLYLLNLYILWFVVIINPVLG